MTHVPVLARIGRQHHCDAPVAGFLSCKLQPAHDAFRDRLDTLGVGLMGKAGKLQMWVARTRLFERCDTGQNAPVHLWQNDMHGQVRGRQPAFGLGPGVPGRGGQRNLKHRHASRIQRRAAIVAFA